MNGSKKVSVILAVYNGSQYIEEQLDSIRLQTQKPDEVIIVDDCSTDDSFNLIKTYISNYGLNNWNVYQNEVNIGWRCNFKKLFLQQAHGEVIFPCDQDDIWRLDKIEKMMNAIENNPDADVVACLVKPFYEKGGKKIKQTHTTESKMGGDICRKSDFDSEFLYVKRPGCAYAVKRDFVQEIAQFWSDRFAHDGILWRFATLKGTLYCYEEPLVYFRRHSDNATNKRAIHSRERLDELGMLKELLCSAMDYMKKIKKILQWQNSSLRWNSGLHLERILLARKVYLNLWQVCSNIKSTTQQRVEYLLI